MDGARIGVGLRHDVAREFETRVIDAELSEEGGGEVGLIAKARHFSCVAYGTSRPNEGDVVFADVELVDVGRPRYAVIGEDDDEGVLPFGRTAQAFHEFPERFVEIGEGIEHWVVQALVGNCPGFVARKGKERFEPRLILRLAVDVLAQLVEHQVIAHAPRTGLAHFGREVHVAQHTVVARGEEVGIHVCEVLVAAIKELRIVAHIAECAGNGGEYARLGGHFHHTRVGKSGIARESADRAAVGAETVGVTL